MNKLKCIHRIEINAVQQINTLYLNGSIYVQVIERSFGLLKSRYRCLDKSGGTLLYTPERACGIVVACCVLHNFCLEHNVALPAAELHAAMHPQDTPDIIIPPTCQSAVALRQHLVAQMFERNN